MNLKLFIKISVSIILLWFLVHTSRLDFSLLSHLLYSPASLLLTLLMYFIVISISTWRWYKLNRAQGIQLSYINTLLPTYLGIAFNNLLPGGVGGDFYRYYFVNKNIPVKKSVVMLSILFDRMTGLLGIFIAVLLFSASRFNFFENNTMAFYFFLISLILSAGLMAFYLFSRLIPNFKNQTLLSLLNAFHVYRDSPKTILECLAASVVIQIMIALTCMVIANMMNFPSISFSDYMIAIALTQIVNLIPVAPGGFGVGEIAFANILLLLNPGINATYATIFLAYRLIGILIFLPGVSVMFLGKGAAVSYRRVD